MFRKSVNHSKNQKDEEAIRTIALRRVVFAYYDNSATHNYEDSEKGIRKLVSDAIKDLKLSRQERNSIYNEFVQVRADMNQKDVGIQFGNAYAETFKTFHDYQTNNRMSTNSAIE